MTNSTQEDSVEYKNYYMDTNFKLYHIPTSKMN